MMHVQRVSFHEFLVTMEAAEWFFIRKQYNGRSCLYCDKKFMIKDPMKVQKTTKMKHHVMSDHAAASFL